MVPHRIRNQPEPHPDLYLLGVSQLTICQSYQYSCYFRDAFGWYLLGLEINLSHTQICTPWELVG